MSAGRVWLFSNGIVIVMDARGQQVPDWQASLFYDHLRRMLDAGVITLDTPVDSMGPFSGPSTVRDWLGVIEPISGMPVSASPNTEADG